MGVGATLAPKGLGPETPTKKWAHWVDLISQPLSVFKIFEPEPPSPPPHPLSKFRDGQVEIPNNLNHALLPIIIGMVSRQILLSQIIGKFPSEPNAS